MASRTAGSKERLPGQLGIEKHKANVILLLQKSSGIAEHPDIIETIEKELEIISKYDDQLEMIKKYFE